MKFAFRHTVAALLLSAALAGPATAQILAGPLTPNPVNVLDNGNLNIAQRGTTAVTSITTTAKYLWDRWAAYSGTSTSTTLTNITSGLPSTFSNAAEVQRVSGQTGVVPVCFVQEVPTSDTIPLAGQPMALSFWAEAGANFSAANGTLTAQIVTGTGTDQGLASLISGWTGAANAVATANAAVTLTTGWQRFAVTGTIPATATEMAVTLCYTPVGTAGTADDFVVTGIQENQGTIAQPFEWRPVSAELKKVQYYAYGFTESATAIQYRGPCMGITTSIDFCTIQLPVAMRKAPTLTLTAGFAATTTNGQSAITACTGLILYATLTGAASSNTEVPLSCTTSAGTPAAGVVGSLWDIGTGSATGVFLASADF